MSGADTSYVKGGGAGLPTADTLTEYDAADFTTVAGGGSDTATLVSGQIRFVHGAALRYYRATTLDAARAIRAIPSGTTRVILIARVATVTTPGSSWDTLGLYLRAGSVEADAPPTVVPVSTAAIQRMPSVVTFRDSGPGVVVGDGAADSFGDYTAFTGQTWDGTRWIALQWDARTGQTFAGLYVSASAPTSPRQFIWTPLRAAVQTSAGNIPTWAVVANPQPGGTPAANQLEVDVIAWVWS